MTRGSGPDAKRTPPLANIPLIVGNLGARTMIQRARRLQPTADPLLAALPEMAAQGFTGVEDYVCWSLVEPGPGTFEFGMYETHRRAAEDAGLDYYIYPWLHSMPAWAFVSADFAPAVCLEHGRPSPFPSLFAPGTEVALDRFYQAIAEHLGEVDGVTVAVPCDYGEVGYPSGLGCWAVDYPAELDHAHPGYWCGDDSAATSFRAAALAKYGDLGGVNRAWGTAFETAETIRPLLPGRPEAGDSYRIDFAAWYEHRLTRFTDRALQRAAARFPTAQLGLKLGFASEDSALGQDYTGLIQLARQHRAVVWSTHGTLDTHFHKRIATPCHHLGVPYFVEGVAERERTAILDRLFEDAACGAEGFFEFHSTFETYREDFLERLPALRGAQPEIDVVLLFNRARLRHHPRLGYPEQLQALCPGLREILDFAIADEQLIEVAGTLDAYGVLGVPDEDPLSDETTAHLREFEAAGGILVTFADDVRLDAPGYRFDGVATPNLELRFGFGCEWHHLGAFIGLERARSYFEDAGDEESCAWFGGTAGCRLPAPATDAELALEIYLPAGSRPDAWRARLTAAHPGPTFVASGDSTLGARELAGELRAGAQTLRLDVPASAPGCVEIRLTGPTFHPDDPDDERGLGVLLRRASLRAKPGPAAAEAAPPAAGLHVVADPHVLARTAFSPRGDGGTLRVPRGDLPRFAAALFAASAHRSAFPGASRRSKRGLDPNFPQADGVRDAVRIAMFADAWLLYNASDVVVDKTIRGAPQPITLPPWGMVTVPRT